MAGRDGGIGRRIGGIRDIGEPRKAFGSVPKGPASPGMPGFGEENAARALFEPIRHAPAYYDPQPSKFDSSKPPKPTPWATWSKSPGPGRSERADRRSGYSSQGLLFDPATYANQAVDDTARAIQAATEGAPQGSVYTAMPDEDRVVRLPKFAAFSRESGAQSQSITEAIRKGALDGTLALRGRDPLGRQVLTPLGKRVTRADIDAAAGSDYEVKAYPSAAAVSTEIGEGSGVFTQPGYRSDVWEYANQRGEPGALGEQGVLVQLNPDGSDFLAVTNADLLKYNSQREADLTDRLPREQRRYAPMRDPAVSFGGEDIATPEDLRGYDRGESRQWRAMRAIDRKRQGRDSRRVNPPEPRGPRSDGYLDGELGAGQVGRKDAKGGRLYREYGGALNLASRELNQNPTRASRLPQGEWQPGGAWVDPSMVVLTRDMDPDSTAAWDRQKEVRLPEFTQFLLDRHKTPLLSRPEEVLTSERFIPEDPQKASEGGTRIGRVVVTERPDHPMFLGLNLPEVAEAISQRKPLVTTAVPLYQARGESGEPLYRIGHPMNRNYDALLKEFNQATGFARDVDVDPVSQAQVAGDNSKMGRYVSAQVLEAARQGGYSITPTDNPFLSKYEAGPGGTLGGWGDSGYLVRPTIVAAGGVNTGTPEPSSRMIRVGSDEWNSGRFSKAHTGIDLLSNQPAVRKAIAERQDLNPEGWTTISLLDEIARYTGAEPGFAGQGAGIERFMDPVNPGAFSIALGQAVPRGAAGRQSETQLEQLRQATQTLANNAHFVQEPIPGVLRGIDPQSGFERLAPRKPEQTGPRTLRELWSRTSRQAEPRLSGSARTRDIRSRMDQQRAAVLAEAAAVPQSELSGTPLLDILAASGGDKALAASPSLAKLLPERNQGLYPLGPELYPPGPEDFDEDALLEELGVTQRQPGWSDLVEIGSNEGSSNLGYRVLERAGDADGPITGRQAALEPFIRLAQRLGNLSPGHAAQVAESAFAQATGAPIDDMAIARRVAQIVRPGLVTGREQVQGLGNSPAPWLAPEEGQWRGQRGDRYNAPRQPNYSPRKAKLASISPQGELQARRDFRALTQADAENERAAYLQDLLSPSGSWAVYGPQRSRPGTAYS